MKTIRAIFENGVSRPLDSVDLPEGTQVELKVEIIVVSDGSSMDRIYKILDERYDTGDHDAAARVDDHQP
jgi:predicted DNA-binding antitoxin AbrB/MazE fold protein